MAWAQVRLEWIGMEGSSSPPLQRNGLSSCGGRPVLERMRYQGQWNGLLIRWPHGAPWAEGRELHARSRGSGAQTYSAKHSGAPDNQFGLPSPSLLP